VKEAFSRSHVYFREGGSIPAAAFPELLGTDSIRRGFGLPDDNLHSPHDRFYLPNFYNGLNEILKELDEVRTSERMINQSRSGSDSAKSDLRLRQGRFFVCLLDRLTVYSQAGNFMRTPSVQKLKTLAQSGDEWQLVIDKMHTWIAPPNEEPYRPYLLLVFNLTTGMIMWNDLVQRAPTAADARAALFTAMVKPPRLTGAASRPRSIGLSEPALVETLKSALDEIDVPLILRSRPPEVRALLEDVGVNMNKGAEPAGLLSIKGATPEFIGSLFSAAAEFYRTAPWVTLTNMNLIAVKQPAERSYRYVSVMGNGGVEYGLATYLHWKDVEQMFAAADDPFDALPDTGAHSLLFNAVTEVPFDDLDAIEQYRWELVNEQAYPVPLIFDKHQKLARRPTLKDLHWYEAALRAIPIFVRDHLQPDGQGDFVPIETTVEVITHAGPLKIQVKYPGGTLPPELQPAPGLGRRDPGDEEAAEEQPFFDRRGLEGTLWQVAAKEFGAEAGSGDPQLDQAQQIMYQAWDESHPGKRITLAHQALAVSPDCADAYVLLAEEAADTVKHAYDYYQRGVEAGRRALGEKYFKQQAGHFWGLLETRPYMRALEGTANLLWELKRRAEAADTYAEMLRLNPNDNQGVRYSLLNLLLEFDRITEAQQLLKKYKGEYSAVWKYTQALIEFRTSGASAKAQRAWQAALKQNSFVPGYLTGQKRIPNRLPDYIGQGDENEASVYAAQHLNHWRCISGAVEWARQFAPAANDRQPQPSPRRRRRR
jgi:tetratricopeptide (TPR) repeat protein